MFWSFAGRGAKSIFRKKLSEIPSDCQKIGSRSGPNFCLQMLSADDTRRQSAFSCADPEKILSEGSNFDNFDNSLFIFLVDERIQIPL